MQDVLSWQQPPYPRFVCLTLVAVFDATFSLLLQHCYQVNDTQLCTAMSQGMYSVSTTDMMYRPQESCNLICGPVCVHAMRDWNQQLATEAQDAEGDTPGEMAVTRYTADATST